VTEKNSCI